MKQNLEETIRLCDILQAHTLKEQTKEATTTYMNLD